MPWASEPAAEPVQPAGGPAVADSSPIKFICALEDLSQAAALVKPAIVNVDVVSSDVRSPMRPASSDVTLRDILQVLPGYNCGRCGYSGCQAYAEALLAGQADVDLCVTGGPEVAQRLAGLVGSSTELVDRAPGFGMPSRDALQTNEETLGSGIVVDPRGYVLTCHHLIKGYPRPWVTVLSSGRTSYRAEVVGADVSNDLAMLKIEPDAPIPAAKLGNSDMVKITDTVLAVGSPFGLEHTVTAGIISDNKRTIVIDGKTYFDFFQTDAAVNRGSAGGALINTEGNVIGVVTAIASTSEYFSGISFAVPINSARTLLFQAIED